MGSQRGREHRRGRGPKRHVRRDRADEACRAQRRQEPGGSAAQDSPERDLGSDLHSAGLAQRELGATVADVAELDERVRVGAEAPQRARGSGRGGQDRVARVDGKRGASRAGAREKQDPYDRETAHVRAHGTGGPRSLPATGENRSCDHRVRRNRLQPRRSLNARSRPRSTLLAAEAGIERRRGLDPARDRAGRLRRPARFLNAAAALETVARRRGSCSSACSRSSAARPRQGEGPRFGPRTIDLDLLLYGDETIDEPGLDRARIRAWPSGASRSSRSPSSTRALDDPRARAASRPCLAGLDDPRMSHLDELDEFEAELELAAQEGVHGGLRALPLLRADAGRDVPLQPARPPVRPAAELPVLPR